VTFSAKTYCLTFYVKRRHPRFVGGAIEISLID